MTFKVQWEKTDQLHKLSHDVISGMVTTAFPEQNLQSFKIISGGCANINAHIKLTSMAESYILRVYLREPDSAFREQSIGRFLQEQFPLPQIYYIGEFADYRFAVSQYLTGISLRELLLGDETYDRDLSAGLR